MSDIQSRFLYLYFFQLLIVVIFALQLFVQVLVVLVQKKTIKIKTIFSAHITHANSGT
jgi:hypothetical protein